MIELKFTLYLIAIDCKVYCKGDTVSRINVLGKGCKVCELQPVITPKLQNC